MLLFFKCSRSHNIVSEVFHLFFRRGHRTRCLISKGLFSCGVWCQTCNSRLQTQSNVLQASAYKESLSPHKVLWSLRQSVTEAERDVWDTHVPVEGCNHGGERRRQISNCSDATILMFVMYFLHFIISLLLFPLRSLVLMGLLILTPLICHIPQSLDSNTHRLTMNHAVRCAWTVARCRRLAACDVAFYSAIQEEKDHQVRRIYFCT